MKLIGISGTNGSGKDSLGEWLADTHEWLFISGSDILREELKKRGLPIERENLRKLSAEWRRQHGLGVLIDMAVKEFERLSEKNQFNGLVVSSLRNSGEADRVHELGGKVIWLDGDPKIRYGRISKRRRSTEDSKTFEQFLSEEQAEMEHAGDAATLDMSGVRQRADIKIQNDTEKIEDFYKIAQDKLGLADNN